MREGVGKKGRSILEMRLEQRKKEVRKLGGGRKVGALPLLASRAKGKRRLFLGSERRILPTVTFGGQPETKKGQEGTGRAKGGKKWAGRGFGGRKGRKSRRLERKARAALEEKGEK